MIEVVQADNRRRQRDFLEFPVWLYKDNPCYVPALYFDEKKIFRKDYVYYDTCKAVYFNAYKDGKMAGRISGIIQQAYNAKMGCRRVRFTRFDVIDDQQVAKALFDALEQWAISNGMDTVCGPLGFSDLEKEGLLVEGFDELSTFEEQYNAPYYEGLITSLGYQKEVEWVESKIYLPKDQETIDEMQKMTDFLFRRYKLHFGTASSAKDFLRKYSDGFFEILDRSYEEVYGTVPFTEGMKKLLMDNFELIIDLRFVAVILDENENVVLMGICFPSLSKAVQASGGHLTPACLMRILKAKRHPDIVDLGLIGVDPKWLNRGISVAIASELVKMLQTPGMKYAETNLNLVDNYAILNLWKRFDAVQHKRRRAYVKELNPSGNEPGVKANDLK